MTVFSSAHGFVRGALSSLAVLLLASGIAHAAIPASERQALLDLYASTNGAGWTTKTNWNGAVGTECGWFGVYCHPPGTNVTGLNLGNNHLVGPLPASINDLSSLTNLNLNHNQLSGSLPSLAALTHVWWLALNSNQFSGSLPSFATNTSLQALYLDTNNFSGPIPPFATSLLNLRLASNHLTGPIPSFSANTGLYLLSLASNELSGPIPSFAANPQLQILELWGNQLTGPIPSFAANTFLQELWLGSNQLSGPVPSFATNTNLQILYLGSNQLSGPVPSFAANTALQFLFLGSNQLTGPVDPSLGTLTNLYAGGLNLRWNGLTATDPALIAFLNAKQDGGDWQSTQTIPVTGLGASGITESQATVNWTPITYTADSGNYQVFTSTVAGGPYTPFATVTANKSATSLTVTGLTPGTPYFLRVQTTTDPHALNQNTVLSGYSAEMRATTSGAPPAVPVPTTTMLGSSANPSTYGNSVTFTATVSASATPAQADLRAASSPTGTVAFQADGAVLADCSAVSLTAAGVATCSTATLTVGNHPIIADYSGDSAYTVSTGTVTGGQTVNPIPQTITNFTFNPTTLTIGGTTIASATGGASGNPVTFTSTTPSVCTVSGNTVTGVAGGTCTLSADQAGNDNYTAAPQVTQSLIVGQTTATTTALTSAPNPSAPGQTVTLTATVSVASAATSAPARPANGSPTGGTVAFQADGAVLAGCSAVPLTASVATCPTAALTAGSHPITARYSGDPTFAASTSPIVTQQVTADIPTLSEWAMLLLTVLLSGLAWRQLTDPTVRSRR